MAEKTKSQKIFSELIDWVVCAVVLLILFAFLGLCGTTNYGVGTDFCC